VTPARFDYARPATLAEALTILAREGEACAPLAGGQSLMPMMAMRLARPPLLLDLNRIAGLDRIAVEGDAVHVGALARHAAVLAHPVIAREVPLLPPALREVAHPAIRNRGTLGGSLSLADPAAELPACMVALDAAIILASAAGERRVGAGVFFQGLYATARRADELLVRVEIPRAADGPVWFGEVARRRGDFAMAGLALAVLDGRPALAFCGVEAAPRRLPDIEAALYEGRDPSPLLARTLEPLGSAETPAAYRMHLAQVLLRRAMEALHAPA
jgi:carbon-monoxide dehydrogenase medium subunit